MGEPAHRTGQHRIGGNILRHDDLGDPRRRVGRRPTQVQAVGVQRLGKFLAEQQAHVLSGDGPGQARHQPTERQRVVGGFAQQPPGHRRRQPLFHHDVIQQVLLRRATQSGQAGLVSHHVTNRQGCLAVGAKRRPILGNGSFVVDQPPVGQPVDDRGRHALGRREHHRRGIRRPRHPSGPISPPLPHVDDRLRRDTPPALRHRTGAPETCWQRLERRTQSVGRPHQTPAGPRPVRRGTKPRGDRLRCQPSHGRTYVDFAATIGKHGFIYLSVRLAISSIC